MSDDDRLLVEGRLATLEEQMRATRADHAEMRADVKTIMATLQEAKGGWRTLMMVGGAAGAVGAVIGKLLPFMPVKP